MVVVFSNFIYNVEIFKKMNSLKIFFLKFILKWYNTLFRRWFYLNTIDHLCLINIVNISTNFINKSNIFVLIYSTSLLSPTILKMKPERTFSTVKNVNIFQAMRNFKDALNNAFRGVNTLLSNIFVANLRVCQFQML